MIKVAVENKKAIIHVLDEQEYEGTIPDIEWKIFKHAAIILEPIKELTVLLSGIKYPTSSIIAPLISKLIKTAEEPIPDDTPEAVQDLANRLVRYLKEYFVGICTPQMLLCSFLDPRFISLHFATDTQTSKFEDFLIEEYDKAKVTFEMTSKNSRVTSNTTIPTPKKKSLMSLAMKPVTPTKSPRKTSRTEINGYKQEIITDPDDVNIFEWWNNIGKKKYPILALLAQKWLACPATSVPVERMWSDAGNIVSDKRASLDSDSVAMLVYLQHNLRALRNIAKEFVW